jgi:hypothetical protein
MPEHQSVELRLLQVLLGIAVVAILGVLAILPYRLYERDIRHATVHAHRLSSVVHTALSHAIVSGDDPADLINRLQGNADVQIHLRKLGPDEVHPAAESLKGSSKLSGTDLHYVAAPILVPGRGSWLAEMDFDLAPMKRESVRLIIDLILAVVVGSAVFSAVVFLLVRNSLIRPLRELAASIERRHPDSVDPRLPVFETREMQALVTAVERARGPHPRQD